MEPDQTDLFNLPLGERLKREGMETAADRRASNLEIARSIGIRIGRRRGHCNADDVGRVLKERFGIATLGPAAGSLFKTPDWSFSGRWVKSKRITNHARMLRDWDYVGVDYGASPASDPRHIQHEDDKNRTASDMVGRIK